MIMLTVVLPAAILLGTACIAYAAYKLFYRPQDTCDQQFWEIISQHDDWENLDDEQSA